MLGTGHLYFALTLGRSTVWPPAWSGEDMIILLIVLLVLALGGGGWGHSRFGYAGWSPAGVILLLFVILYLTGNLHLR